MNKLDLEQLLFFCEECDDVIDKLNIVAEAKNRVYRNTAKFILDGTNPKRERIQKSRILVDESLISEVDYQELRNIIRNNTIKDTNDTQDEFLNRIDIEKIKPQKQIYNENKKRGIACCPKCGSTSITTTNKKLSATRGIVGGAVGSLINPLGTAVGAVAGGLSSKKIYNVCMNCRHKWKP